MKKQMIRELKHMKHMLNLLHNGWKNKFFWSRCAAEEFVQSLIPDAEDCNSYNVWVIGLKGIKNWCGLLYCEPDFESTPCGVYESVPGGHMPLNEWRGDHIRKRTIHVFSLINPEREIEEVVID